MSKRKILHIIAMSRTRAFPSQCRRPIYQLPLSATVDEDELHLLKIATSRDECLKTLRIHFKPQIKSIQDEKSLLKVLYTIIELRQRTLDVINQLVLSQRRFVRVTRPLLFGGEDYVKNMMNSTDFMMAFRVRSVLCLQFQSNNIFLLPIVSKRGEEKRDKVEVSATLLAALETFASPPIGRIAAAYKALSSFLPKNDKLFPLSSWEIAPWRVGEFVAVKVDKDLPETTKQKTRSIIKRVPRQKFVRDEHTKTCQSFALSTKFLREEFMKEKLP